MNETMYSLDVGVARGYIKLVVHQTHAMDVKFCTAHDDTIRKVLDDVAINHSDNAYMYVPNDFKTHAFQSVHIDINLYLECGEDTFIDNNR